MSSTTPETQLVQCAQEGDAEAFRLLFERYVGAVRRFLHDVMRDESLAHEATQETFVRAHAQLPRLAERSRVKSWLFGIARNVAFEEHRARRTWDSIDDQEAPIRAVLPAPDPERLLLDRELERHFDEAMGALSASRRAVLSLRLEHGLSYDEIAATMNWTLPQVKNEIHRARLKLRELLLPHIRVM